MTVAADWRVPGELWRRARGLRIRPQVVVETPPSDRKGLSNDIGSILWRVRPPQGVSEQSSTSYLVNRGEASLPPVTVQPDRLPLGFFQVCVRQRASVSPDFTKTTSRPSAARGGPNPGPFVVPCLSRCGRSRWALRRAHADGGGDRLSLPRSTCRCGLGLRRLDTDNRSRERCPTL